MKCVRLTTRQSHDYSHNTCLSILFTDFNEHMLFLGTELYPKVRFSGFLLILECIRFYHAYLLLVY